MRDLKELLLESGCSSEFILDAMRFEHLFTGDIDAFLDKVEDILMNEEEYDETIDEDDEDFDEEEDDPIYQSDYNYDGNEDNIYFEDEDGEEAFEDDEDEE
jgi:DNA-directed RNA polymerase subunit delta